MVYKIAFLLCCVVYMASANEGESCVKEGVPGTCINIRNCPGAIQDLKNRKTPQRCSFIGSDPVVCCTDGSPPPQPTPAPTPAPTQPPTAAPVTKPQPGPVGGTTERCEPLDSRLTSNRTGQKAWDMCLEYQQKLVYPCKRSVALGGGFNRYHLCHHNADDLIIGGEDAAENEFTHMVLLGYGSDEASVQWQCGGSLISDQWVLTAGHCTVSRELGPVTFLQIGALKRSQLPPKGLRRVAQVVSAPQYAPPARYHDIALVKADTPVKLDQFLVPACVHVGDPVPEERVLATGWGLTDYKGSQADHLQKVILDQFTFTECSAMYGKPRLMKQGVDDTTQSCYGHKKMSKDTCQGDSGGPIMIKSKKMHCMYVVTGVTSFGKRCGKIGDPAIYTRVRNYVDWIESVVWPSA